jgi:hypothetical protein
MSKEYIERNALLSDISETVIFSGKPGHTSAEARGAHKVISRIREAPAADVVEVVRCRECRHYTLAPSYNGLPSDLYCKVWDVDDYYEAVTAPDDYCSYGERKDGKENDE